MQIGFCRCAFSDEGCDVINITQEEAYNFIERKYREWVKGLIQTAGEQCLSENGRWNTNTRQCTTCTEGQVLDGTACVAPEEARDVVGGQCQALRDFGEDWRAYSDFNQSSAASEASAEVQEYNRTLETFAQKVAAAHALAYDMEIDRQVRLDLLAYNTALIAGLPETVSPALARLTLVSNSLVPESSEVESPYIALVDPASLDETVGTKLTTIASSAASGSPPKFSVSDTVEQVEASAWGTSLSIITGIGDPTASATQALVGIRAATPALELTDEEVAILQQEHRTTLRADKALAQSYAANAVRRRERLGLETEIATLYNELERWRGAEYSRAQAALEASCQQ